MVREGVAPGMGRRHGGSPRMTRAGEVPRPLDFTWPSRRSGGLPLALDFLVVLVQVDVVVDLRHPGHRDPVVLAVGAVVLRQLNRVTLDVVHLADLRAA